MAGGGYYPTMTDIEWRNAPWNQPEPVYDTCPDCNGDGGVWYNGDGDEYSVADYSRMSKEMQRGLKFDKCERCNGEGEIIAEEYEPDYDDYD